MVHSKFCFFAKLKGCRNIQRKISYAMQLKLGLYMKWKHLPGRNLLKKFQGAV